MISTCRPAHVAHLLAEHLRALRAQALARIGADGHEPDAHRDRDFPDQIGAEDHRPGQDRHDGDLRLPLHLRRRVIGGNLPGHLPNPDSNLFLGDQDAVDVELHIVNLIA
jgi:hypothetical protein